MAEAQQYKFLDVPTLLERSNPKPRLAFMGYLGAAFLAVVVISAGINLQWEGGQRVVRLLAGFAFIVVIAVLGLVTVWTARSLQRERTRLEAIDELVRLRRWTEAGAIIEETLSQPARTPQGRAQALIFLAGVLARFHRFGDAVSVYEHLLSDPQIDADTSHGLRLGRAMSLLRDDRLFDVDRAINELRRSPRADQSAGLALLEIYRDVKTGHPQEAIEVFVERLPVMRVQLGHRVADAYGLAARAYDLLGDRAAAQGAYENATLLSPESELHRRYPEIAALAGRYSPSPIPREAP